MLLDRYDSIKTLVKMGDVILFTSTDPISEIIRVATNSVYTHVGMFLWSTVPYDPIERLFIIESTLYNNIPDLSGEYRHGVQMSLASQRVEAHHGQAWWLALKDQLTTDQKTNMCSWLFKKYSDKTDYDMLQAIEAGINYRFGTGSLLGKENLRRLFCSELVCKALQLAGQLDLTIDPSKVLPKEIPTFDIFNPIVTL